MRTPVRSILSVVTLGVLASSYQIGQAATTNTFSAAPAQTDTATATPTPTATKTSAPTPTPAASGTTQTSGLVQYRYGMIQLSVTKSNGKITDVGLLTATATAGRDQAFSYLVDYAIQSNGSGFGNLSQATFTTVAFKKALDQALAKF